MPEVHERSTGELIRDVADDVRLLVRKELELARRELMEAVSSKLKGAGLIAAAAIALLPGLFFLVVALALWIPLGPAGGFAVVGGTMVLLVCVAALVGVRLIRKDSPKPGKALESVKEDVRWAKRRLKR